MVYEFFYKAKAEPGRNFDITYAVAKEGKAYYLESFINGTEKKKALFLEIAAKKRQTKLQSFWRKKRYVHCMLMT